ncbi:MAG: helix-turn-helix domain-containing protein [Acidobacteriia bacterium]|nr:helix-turn-helix domain-containing protein [Terriglobia bacterium]
MSPDRKERSRDKTLQLRIGQPFNPFKLFNGIFIPEALVRYRGLTLGAKIAYGRLARYAGENGKCWPSIPTLGNEIGIGATQARIYVHELCRKQFINVEQRPGTSGFYTFLWHEAFAGEMGEKRKAPPLRITEGVPPRKTGDRPLRKSVPLPLRKTEDEENHHQESHMKESQSEESQHCGSSEFAIPREARNQNLTASFSVDDDEKRKAQGSPWEELCSEFKNANAGVEMGYLDERWLKENMELRCITADALLKLVHENPLRGFRSPMAGLKWLAKKFRTKTKSAAHLESEVQRRHPRAPNEIPRCEKCQNTGRVLECVQGEQRPRATEQYCDCQMGKELEAVERRKKKASMPLDQQTGQGRPPWSSATPSGESLEQYACK